MPEHAEPGYLDHPVMGYVEPVRSLRARGFEHDHEVRVWLPPSYKHTTQDYPTLWVMDNALEVGITAMMGSLEGNGTEVIVVAVGGHRDLPAVEFQRRRQYDFSPERDLIAPAARTHLEQQRVGGAAAFRDFLVDRLRPALADEYRMDPRDHGFAGHSGGAMFGIYTLFTRPSAFGKYILASPGSGFDLLAMEAAYAASHDDLPARVFVAAGEAEVTDFFMAKAGIWSTTASIVEALATRGYPSLDLELAVLPGQTHLSAGPVAYIDGVRWLWREGIAKNTKADYDALVRALAARGLGRHDD